MKKEPEKKTEAKPPQQKLCFHIMIIYDYHVIWVWVKLRLPEEWMVTNKKNTALAYPSHCKIYRRPLKSSNISCSI